MARACRVVMLCMLAMPQLGGCAGLSDLRGYASDGCSLFPDGNLSDRKLWCDCCFNHDITYWRGGGEDQRKQADSLLRDCVWKRTGDKVLAEAMYEGVRIGGSAYFPTWYRWGYGWSYGRGYQPLSEEEHRQADDMQDQYLLTHPQGYCEK